MDFLLTLVVYFLAFALGASTGSFLSVVIHRIPAGLSILLPPSQCPKCQYRLKRRENVPILGWFWLRGRCARCRAPISLRYPLLEAACGGVFLLIFVGFGVSWQTLGYWLLFGWLLALALIDIDTMTLPNPLTQSGLVAGLVFQGVVGMSVSSSLTGGISQLMDGVLGAVLGLWLLDAIAIAGSVALGQTAMGGGDAKLAA
ncbi:MAG: prepilin peptidase, partial [Leptolyngbyaceae cyanobacterium RU_5_1]|nr:prepilin peptidase [Leptolyngbyaceae cyanobacterium RU_5_1]